MNQHIKIKHPEIYVENHSSGVKNNTYSCSDFDEK